MSQIPRGAVAEPSHIIPATWRGRTKTYIFAGEPSDKLPQSSDPFMADPVRDLNNFLQGQPGGSGGNATQDFQWILTREGPEHCTTYHVTAVFRGVNVGVGHGSTKGIAKRNASMQALDYLKTHLPPGL